MPLTVRASHTPDRFEGEVARELGRLIPDVPYGYYANQILVPTHSQVHDREVFNEFDNVLFLPWSGYAVEAMAYWDGYYDLRANGQPRYRADDDQFHLTDGKTKVRNARYCPVTKGQRKSKVLMGFCCNDVDKAFLNYPFDFLLVVPNGARLTLGTTGAALRNRAVNLRDLVPTILNDPRARAGGRRFPEALLKKAYTALDVPPPSGLTGTVCHDIRLGAELPGPGTEFGLRVRAFAGEWLRPMADAAATPVAEVEARFYHLWPWGEPVSRYLDHVGRQLAALVRVRAPGVLGVVHFATDPDRLMIAYERFDGVPLDEVVRARGPLPPATVRALLRQLLGTVAVVHDARVVHLNVCPKNVLLPAAAPDPAGARHKLTGFVNPHVDADRVSTAVFDNAFDRSFAAPELGLPGGEYRDRPLPDVYSLGRLALFCLLGEPEYRDRAERDEAEQNPSPKHLVPSTADPALARVIEQATVGYAPSRYATCAAMLAALGGA